jgi:hypothetical protein
MLTAGIRKIRIQGDKAGVISANPVFRMLYPEKESIED